ncbi:penicillin-binding transpeptidase domain-containing protein [Streptomyces sp. NPDC005925]|uniref:penicillin-binding transpeptidase domain-containing protein n=1 Tax=Streptomyces sp. NPDC005925 TaxID=3157172 RepID=UPI0033F711C6
MGNRRRVAERRSTRYRQYMRQPAVLGGAIAVVVVGAGAGGYAVWAKHNEQQTVAVFRPGPVSHEEVTTVARRFLTAWQGGRVAEAAAVTDDPEAAGAMLTGFTKDAHVKNAAFTTGRAADDTMPFKVRGTVSYQDISKPLGYDSTLTVVRAKNGKPVVDWHASVVHPDLKDGDRLATGEAGTPPVKALDRNGDELTAKKYPSLGTILDGLREKYGKTAGGSAGIELRVLRGKASKAAELADKTLLELSKGTPGTVKTTLSPDLQAAAEREVGERKRASVVVVRPSTGEILAAANSSHGFNVAFQGSLAPGSTMKVITSSLLIDKGLAAADKKHPCPKYFTYGGWKFQNDDKFEIKDGTFTASFARSCNTAFISQAPELENGDLTKQAQEVFGLGRNDWAIGVPSFDGAVPVQSQAQMAASLIGQGGVRMNPLNMASVSATVQSGSFRQPYLVSPDVDHRTLATASRKLSGDTLRQLRALMAYTASYGTAAEAMAGISGGGAKTGSAEVDGQEKPNGWFTAYRGDLAAAGVVEQGGHGGSTAGPIVAALLKAGG